MERIYANDGDWSNWYYVEFLPFLNYLKAKGYDAAKMREDGSDTYVFFGDDPHQVQLQHN